VNDRLGGKTAAVTWVSPLHYNPEKDENDKMSLRG